MKKELVCIVCPVGCDLEVTLEGDKVTNVEGNECKRGVDYAHQEAVAPTRTLATTVRVKGGVLPLVPVKTDAPVPKEKIKEITDILAQVELEAPVGFNSIIVEDILGTGANVISTRSMRKAQDAAS